MKIHVNLAKLNNIYEKLSESYRKTLSLSDNFNDLSRVAADLDVGDFDEALDRRLLDIKRDLEKELFCIAKHMEYIDRVRSAYQEVENGLSNEDPRRNNPAAGFVKNYVLRGRKALLPDDAIPAGFDGHFSEISVGPVLDEDSYIIEPWLKDEME